ncbi:hypothetical protein HC891_13035 [Candidatus Gracilibacteria bacterium]|nr:hypothetical protein [Candidatus Gracilibacteria bacterium]
MRLSFIFPFALTLLALVPLLWAFAFATNAVNVRRLGTWRWPALFVLRSLILLALIFALAGTQIRRPVDMLTTVFLVDGSDSFPLLNARPHGSISTRRWRRKTQAIRRRW